jgi:hypothetical protein
MASAERINEEVTPSPRISPRLSPSYSKRSNVEFYTGETTIVPRSLSEKHTNNSTQSTPSSIFKALRVPPTEQLKKSFQQFLEKHYFTTTGMMRTWASHLNHYRQLEAIDNTCRRYKMGTEKDCQPFFGSVYKHWATIRDAWRECTEGEGQLLFAQGSTYMQYKCAHSDAPTEERPSSSPSSTSTWIKETTHDQIKAYEVLWEYIQSTVHESDTCKRMLALNALNDLMYVHQVPPSDDGIEYPDGTSGPEQCASDSLAAYDNPVYTPTLACGHADDPDIICMVPLHPYPTGGLLSPLFSNGDTGRSSCSSSSLCSTPKSVSSSQSVPEDAGTNEVPSSSSSMAVRYPQYLDAYFRNEHFSPENTNPLQQCLDTAHATFGSIMTMYTPPSKISISEIDKLLRHMRTSIMELIKLREQVYHRRAFCSEFRRWEELACSRLSTNRTATWRTRHVMTPGQLFRTFVSNIRQQKYTSSRRYTDSWEKWQKTLTDLEASVEQDRHTFQTLNDVATEIISAARTYLQPTDIRKVRARCQKRCRDGHAEKLCRFYRMMGEFYNREVLRSPDKKLPIQPEWILAHRRHMDSLTLLEKYYVDHVCRVWLRYIQDCRVQWNLVSLVSTYTLRKSTLQATHARLCYNLHELNPSVVANRLFEQHSKDTPMSRTTEPFLPVYTKMKHSSTIRSFESEHGILEQDYDLDARGCFREEQVCFSDTYAGPENFLSGAVRHSEFIVDPAKDNMHVLCAALRMLHVNVRWPGESKGENWLHSPEEGMAHVGRLIESLATNNQWMSYLYLLMEWTAWTVYYLAYYASLQKRQSSDRNQQTTSHSQNTKLQSQHAMPWFDSPAIWARAIAAMVYSFTREPRFASSSHNLLNDDRSRVLLWYVLATLARLRRIVKADDGKLSGYFRRTKSTSSVPQQIHNTARSDSQPCKNGTAKWVLQDCLPVLERWFFTKSTSQTPTVVHDIYRSLSRALEKESETGEALSRSNSLSSESLHKTCREDVEASLREKLLTGCRSIEMLRRTLESMYKPQVSQGGGQRERSLSPSSPSSSSSLSLPASPSVNEIDASTVSSTSSETPTPSSTCNLRELFPWWDKVFKDT